jgi:CRP/FNR family transcriptional regulator, cyclic AMP receptor protein
VTTWACDYSHIAPELSRAGHGGCGGMNVNTVAATDVPNAEDMPQPLYDDYVARAKIRSFGRGKTIVAKGEMDRAAYVIVAGRVQVQLHSHGGKEVVLRDLTVRQIFGEIAALDAQPRSAEVVALTECRLAAMPADEFADFLANVPGAGLWLSQLLAHRIRDLTDKAFELATLPVAVRVQSEILRQLSQSNSIDNDRAEIDGFPTHSKIAARLGTHREAISRELGLLKAEGLVEQSGRTLIVKSVSRLAALKDRLSQ